MANQYIFPTSQELKEIEQDKMPRLTQDRPIFDILPIEFADEAVLKWEQWDNFSGMQNVRGLDGQPGFVQRIGMNQFQMQPGAYGDWTQITEQEITEARQAGTFGTPINLEEQVIRCQDMLLQRRLDRVEWIGWQLLSYGMFATANSAGQIMHTDSFSLQTQTSSVAWSTAATSTPLADFRTAQLLGRGHSVNFGNVARAYMNQTTFNQMMANTNASDLYGRRTPGLATINNAQDVNALLFGDNLPQIAIYDMTWQDTSGTPHTFIPDGVVIVIGQRPAGQLLGNFRMTRNANNADAAPGPCTKVIDKGEQQVPRLIEVHDNFNGGPVIYYGTAIIIMNVS